MSDLFISSHPRLRDFKEAVSAAAMQQDDELDEEEEMVVDESQEVAMGQVKCCIIKIIITPTQST